MLNKKQLTAKAKLHLQVLCDEIKERRVGGEGNRQATAYVKNFLQKNDWQVASEELSVIDWETEGATLIGGGYSFEVLSSHYARGCSAEGKLVAVNTLEKLERTDIRGKLVLLYGEIASQQIAPKNFPFWNPDEHKHLISVLEEGEPLALICATERNSATAGGVYPFPLFEDGDFDIPSVYMKDTEGERLLVLDGEMVKLESKARRIPEKAFQVIGRQDDSMRDRVVISAHIDAKIGTPGAIDNGTGVAVLLLLSEMLKVHSGKYPVELVFFNGEDYYGAPGQIFYVEQHAGHFEDIFLNINIDGAGYCEGLSCFSAFELPPDVQSALDEMIADDPVLVAGLPWYQGDHSIFLQNGRPAIAVSSQWFIENMESQQITHTPADKLSIVNYDRVAECALGIVKLLDRL